MSNTTEPKILLWDIETSLMTVRTFGLYQDITNHNMIEKDWHIICLAYKWLGKKKVHGIRKNGVEGDYELCKAIREVLIEADIVVHHNGDKFDVKKLNARLIYHGLPPIPKLVVVDTLKHARRIAKFTSNRLDYLGKHLGVNGKLVNTPNLWPLATDGDEQAIRKMLTYCKRDVIILEDVYLILRPYMQGHPNFNAITETEHNCPSCGSSELQKRGTTVTRTGKYQRYQCQACGSWSKGKSNMFTKVDKR